MTGLPEIVAWPGESDPLRHAAIVAAIGELTPTPVTGADFASTFLEWMLRQWPKTVNLRPVLPQEAAAQLRHFSKTLGALAESARGLSGKALGETGWFPIPAALAHLLSEAESLGAMGDDAAARLDERKKEGNPSGRDQYLSALAYYCAEVYQLVTGKAAPTGRSKTAFSEFVAKIMAAGKLPGTAEHYAGLGARLCAEQSRSGTSLIGWQLKA